MGENNTGPEEAIKGVVAGVKGKAKEVGGAVLGQDDLYREGRPSTTMLRRSTTPPRRKPRPKAPARQQRSPSNASAPNSSRHVAGPR